MSQAILRSQRGAAVMIGVMGLAVLIAAIVIAANGYIENTLAAVSLQRDRIAGIQVLQDFAVLAQKAREVFLNNGGCPASAPTQSPAGFCWNAAQSCVRNPIGVNSNICLAFPAAAASAGQVLNVAQLTEDGLPILNGVPEDTGRWRRMVAYFKQVAEYREEIIAYAERDLIGLVSGEAYAARPELHLPGVGAPDPAGPAQLTINNRGCNSPIGAWNSDYCKICGAGATQVQCIELRVCVAAVGCRNINAPAPNYFKDWYRQRIGIIPR